MRNVMKLMLLFKLLLVLWIVCPIYAVTAQVGENLLSLEKDNYPTERVFVHTDRDVYAQGDTIFMRSFLFDANKNLSADYSRYIYVELQDVEGQLLCKEKIAYDTLKRAFYGYMKLGTDLQDGKYIVKAYTYWMNNQDKDSFFNKEIRVVTEKEKLPLEGAYMQYPNQISDFVLNAQKGQGDVKVAISSLNDMYAEISISVVDGRYIGTAVETDTYLVPKSSFPIPILNTEPNYFMERGVVLSGYVVDRKGKILPNSKIAFIGEDSRMYCVDSDSQGYVECPVEWNNKIRFYTRCLKGLADKDVLFKFDESVYATSVVNNMSVNESIDPLMEKYGWTDTEVRSAMKDQMRPYQSNLYVRGMGDAVVSTTTYYSSGSHINAFHPSGNGPEKVTVKSKRKKNIQRVINGPQVNNVEFVFNGGATRYWNYNAVVSKDKPFEFTFPTAADCRTYTVVVNGVDNEGNPVSGVWSIEN